MSNPFSTKAGKSPSKTKKILRSAIPRPRSSDGSTIGSEAKRENPWSSTARSTTKPSTKRSSTAPPRLKRVSTSPTSTSREAGAERRQSGYTSKPLRTGPDVSGVSVGDRVRLTWAVDRAYAMPGSGEFVGVVTVLNDWITVVDNKRVKFHYPVSTLSGCEVLGVDRQRRIKRRG